MTQIEYTCNVTGKNFMLNDNEKHRETAVRFECNSRHRALIYFLIKGLFGESKILSNLNKNKKIKGIGMSDSGFDKILEDKFNYVNTFYHQPPFLDIYNEDHIKNYKDLDFIICSDVFEHISPYPGLQKAFDNLYKMLKPNGFVVFSVPYNDKQHIEHYPNLFNYNVSLIDDKYVITNYTQTGEKEIFYDPVFHGGPGTTIEMRHFSIQSISDYFIKANFSKITFNEIDQNLNSHGIFWHTELDLIITAIKYC